MINLPFERKLLLLLLITNSTHPLLLQLQNVYTTLKLGEV